MPNPNLTIRPRRLRRSEPLRRMLQRVHLRPSDFILPVFVTDGAGVRREVASMPGVFQMSIDVATDWLARRAEEGFSACLLFGVIDRKQKDAVGSAALDPDNVVCRCIRAIKQKQLPLLAITDLCFCEYTDHGHCGPLSDDRTTVANDPTLERLVQQALSHARAGADIIAPSGMMDGMIAALRSGLDEAGFQDIALLSYAVKYASAFYGPFRDAADSAPAFGDRRSYQMDPARGLDEALLEADLDLQQGADMLMVKPAMAYLDVIAAVRQRTHVPVVAYHTSGEYAMIEAAARNGWIDRDRVLLESLTAIRRAGADLIITYHGDILAPLLK